MSSDISTARAIIHVDVDAFYSQVEELREPSLRGRPLAVTQKYLVVTCNYAARARGVTKLMATAEARRKCPELACVSGEDLTPYRAASKAVRAALERFGPVQKLGLDEFALDVSRRSREAHADPSAAPRWHGHVHAAGDGTSTAEAQAGSAARHRPMDLRAHGAEAGGSRPAAPEDALLMAATAIAAEARAAVLAATGLRCSAGVAHNRLLAKLAAGLRKPDGQTALPPSEALAFMGPLPVRALPGVGSRVERALREVLAVRTVADLRAHPLAALARALAAAGSGGAHVSARALAEMALGEDSSPVVPGAAAPKSVSVEDSFPKLGDWEGVDTLVGRLSRDLVARLLEEAAEHGRRARKLIVTWRPIVDGGPRGYAARRTSRSCALPEGASGCCRAGAAADAPALSAAARCLAAAARQLMRAHLAQPFHLTLLNLAATGFEQMPRGVAAGAGAALGSSPPAAAAAAAGGPLLGKAEQRAARTGTAAHLFGAPHSAAPRSCAAGGEATDPFWAALSSADADDLNERRGPARGVGSPEAAGRAYASGAAAAALAPGAWTCEACTLQNDKADAPVCEACQTRRPPSALGSGGGLDSGCQGTPPRSAKRRRDAQSPACSPGAAAASRGRPGGAGARAAGRPASVGLGTIEAFLKRGGSASS